MEECVGRCGPDLSPHIQGDGRPFNHEDTGDSPAVAASPPASQPVQLAALRGRHARHRRPQAEGRARAPGPRPTRHVVLFLASNPSGTTRLALDEECGAIEREIAMTPARDDFDFRSKWAVTVDEMMRCLNALQPMIIHFSGHGSCETGLRLPAGTEAPPATAASPRRDIEPDGHTGIYLQDTCVTGGALALMIASAAPSARVLVLNACSSDAVAESLRKEVDCVVSMNGAVADEAARSFAVGFYRALGNCRSVANAVAQAVATLAAKQLPDEHLPVCRTRSGVSADQIFLRRPDLPWP